MIFDITPAEKTVPPVTSWGRAILATPLTDQDTSHIESLREMERSYHTRLRLNSADIFDNKWGDELQQEVFDMSYPLRDLLEISSIKKKEWLLFWEIYSIYVIKPLSTQYESRKADLRNRGKSRGGPAVSLKGIPFRTFHIKDNSEHSVNCMRVAIHRIEYETHAQINWDWLATYAPSDVVRDREQWLTGVDGEGGYSIANMRAWKNKINTIMRVADAIICHNDIVDETPSSIIFPLLNLNAGGIAIVQLPRISTSATVSMIHIFARAFESTTIIHTTALDRVYLCGNGFLDNITAKHQKLLYDYCNSYPGGQNMSPFSAEYVSGDEFSATVETVSGIVNKLNDWRYEFYDKMLHLCSELRKNAAARTFDKYTHNILSSAYADVSKRWISTTSFNLFGKLIQLKIE